MMRRAVQPGPGKGGAHSVWERRLQQQPDKRGGQRPGVGPCQREKEQSSGGRCMCHAELCCPGQRFSPSVSRPHVRCPCWGPPAPGTSPCTRAHLFSHPCPQSPSLSQGLGIRPLPDLSPTSPHPHPGPRPPPWEAPGLPTAPPRSRGGREAEGPGLRSDPCSPWVFSPQLQ